jgi:hypothetical protein
VDLDGYQPPTSVVVADVQYLGISGNSEVFEPNCQWGIGCEANVNTSGVRSRECKQGINLFKVGAESRNYCAPPVNTALWARS